MVALVIKNPSAHAGGVRDLGLIPGLGRSPEGRNGNPLSSILAWGLSWTEDPGGATVHRVTKSWTQLQ